MAEGTMGDVSVPLPGRFRVAATLRLRHGRLAEVLRARGWSQHALAVYLGVRDMDVSAWMRFKGHKPRDPEVLRKLMELTGWADEDLFPARIYNAPKTERPMTELSTVQDVAITTLLVSRPRLPAAPSAETLYEETERRERVRALLDTLSPRQAQILARRFGFDGPPETLEEVAKAFGVSRERIRGIEIVALRKLRHPGRYHIVYDYAPPGILPASSADRAAVASAARHVKTIAQHVAMVAPSPSPGVSEQQSLHKPQPPSPPPAPRVPIQVIVPVGATEAYHVLLPTTIGEATVECVAHRAAPVCPCGRYALLWED